MRDDAIQRCFMEMSRHIQEKDRELQVVKEQLEDITHILMAVTREVEQLKK